MNNNLEQLSRIYNTLLMVHTKGDDTMVMADCLRALQQTIVAMQNEYLEGQVAPIAVEE